VRILFGEANNSHFEFRALPVNSPKRRFGKNDQISGVFHPLEEKGGGGKRAKSALLVFVVGRSLTLSGWPALLVSGEEPAGSAHDSAQGKSSTRKPHRKSIARLQPRFHGLQFHPLHCFQRQFALAFTGAFSRRLSNRCIKRSSMRGISMTIMCASSEGPMNFIIMSRPMTFLKNRRSHHAVCLRFRLPSRRASRSQRIQLCYKGMRRVAARAVLKSPCCYRKIRR
jgi:hypothetical protein